MQVVFRADASVEIGSGHVMRCLTLARALRAVGCDCTFVCRAHSGDLTAKISAEGFGLIVLDGGRQADAQRPGQGPDYAEWLGVSQEEDVTQTCDALLASGIHADWLVTDHYAIDATWERAVRERSCDRIFVIDDLANRRHDADLLLDQNLGRTAVDYRALTPAGCALLVGPTFALLRPEFSDWRPASLARRKNKSRVEHVLVTMGGADSGNATGCVLDALESGAVIPTDTQITVVVGAQSPWADDIVAQARASTTPINVVHAASNMAELMCAADLIIGASGSTAWEWCALGVPSIAIALAPNQQQIAEALEQIGAAVRTTLPASSTNISKAYQKSTTNLELMSIAARHVSDGGGAKRVAKQLQKVAS